MATRSQAARVGLWRTGEALVCGRLQQLTVDAPRVGRSCVPKSTIRRRDDAVTAAWPSRRSTQAQAAPGASAMSRHAAMQAQRDRESVGSSVATCDSGRSAGAGCRSALWPRRTKSYGKLERMAKGERSGNGDEYDCHGISIGMPPYWMPGQSRVTQRRH
jgi:hypothetical protein